MDYWTLRRHAIELPAILGEKATLLRAVDLAPRGLGLIFKSLTGICCAEILVFPDQQWLRVTPAWDEGPKESQFVRSLNRALTNSRLMGVDVQGFDRILMLGFKVVERFFQTSKKVALRCEFTGRVSNILLCDDQDTVLDQLRPTGNNHPKSLYQPPESPRGLEELKTIEASRLSSILDNEPGEIKRFLQGITPLVMKEWGFRSKELPPDQRGEAFRALLTEFAPPEKILQKTFDVSSGQPVGIPRKDVHLFVQQNRVAAVSQADLRYLSTHVRLDYPTVNEAFHYIHQEIHQRQEFDGLRQRVLAKYEKERKRLQQVQEDQQNRIREYEHAAQWRHFGELLLREVKAIPARASEVVLDDLETGFPVRIPLNPTRTGSQNAQKYFTQYKKARRGLEEARGRAKQVKEKLDWINEQLWYSETAECAADLAVLAHQLAPEVTRAQRKPPHGSRHKGASAFETRRGKRHQPLLEADGCRFYVGRNGRQNQEITFQVGKKGDLWFHALDVPGSHVIAKRPEGAITEQDLLHGAQLAAWFSFSRQSSKVAVDFTDVGWVRKISGAEPGRVYYTHQKTIVVDPREAALLLDSKAVLHE